MSEIKLDEEALGFMRLFQDLTGVAIKDCVDLGGKIVFVVEPGDVGRAVGKGGDKVVQFSKMTGRDVLVVEFSPDPAEFVRSIFRSYGAKDVRIEDKDGVVEAIVTVEVTMKGKAIGRDGRNLKMAREIVRRHHPIDSVRVA